MARVIALKVMCYAMINGITLVRYVGHCQYIQFKKVLATESLILLLFSLIPEIKGYRSVIVPGWHRYVQYLNITACLPFTKELHIR